MIIPVSAKVHFPILLKLAMSIPSRRPAFSALFSTLLLTGMCLAQTTERVSVDSLGAQGDGDCSNSSIAGDGRYVAFDSVASNLVAGDTNGCNDIFVHDRQTGVTERVSVDSHGIEGNGRSYTPSISGDGRYVAFRSLANNLVAGDLNWVDDIFVHDRQTGVTERVSVDSLGIEGNGWSYTASISGDGRYVAFDSESSNLVAGDLNGWKDIFVHDRQTGVTERVNVNSLGIEKRVGERPSISGDGRYVAFSSKSSNLVAGDTNRGYDVFVHDRQTGVTERVSVDSLGAETEWYSKNERPSISAAGRYVAFESRADIFVRDRWNGLGENSIYLGGDSTAPVGEPLKLSWQATRGNSQYWLTCSRNLNGAVVGGHNFDIGYPGFVLATGTNAPNGIGRFWSAPVSPIAAGFTIYFEVAAMDADGILYDSNAHAVTFY